MIALDLITQVMKEADPIPFDIQCGLQVSGPKHLQKHPTDHRHRTYKVTGSLRRNPSQQVKLFFDGQRMMLSCVSGPTYTVLLVLAKRV